MTGRPVLEKARPEDLGGIDEERQALVDAVADLTRELADSLLADPPSTPGGVPGWWAAGRERRVVRLQGLIERHMLRLGEVGAWEVLEEHNPQAEGWSAEVMAGWIAAAALHHAELHDAAGQTAAIGAAAAPPPPEEGGLGAALLVAAAVWAGADALRRGETAATEARSFGGHDAAEASEMTRKTWRTTSGDPRSQHAALNGETVPMGSLFSNGLRWPGDGMGDADQTANCRCELIYTRE